MAFNYATGQYEPDPQVQQQAQPTMADWFRLSGYDPNMSQAFGAGGGATQPTQLNGGVVGPVTQPPNQPNNNPNNLTLPPGAGPDYTNQSPQQAQAGQPPWTPPPGAVATPPPLTNLGDGRVGPSQNGYTQVGGAAAGSTNPLQVFSQNAGNDPTKPPDNSGGWFWDNLAGRWVNTAGNMDSSGRVLSDAEKTYWQGYDHARASGTLDSYLRTVKNPGLAAGTQAQYGPGIATTTMPGRFLDTTGAATTNPAVAAGAAPAAAQVQANPLDPAWDFSKPGSVPWQAFIKNLFADSNAQQSYKELQGVLTPEQVNAATTQYGWQGVANSAGSDANAVYRAAIQAAQADPSTDYSVVRMQDPNTGQLAYGIMKRAQTAAAQEAGGFYAPGSTNPNSPANKAAAEAAQARARASSGGGRATTFSPKGTGKGSSTTQQGLPGGGGGKLTDAQIQAQLIKGVHTLTLPMINALARQKNGTSKATYPTVGSGGVTQPAQPKAPEKLGPPLPPPHQSLIANPGNPHPNVPQPATGQQQMAHYEGQIDMTGTQIWRAGRWQPLPPGAVRLTKY